MKGAILEKGVEQYTNLNLFLPIIREEIFSYNWLLTDIDSNYYSDNTIENNYDFLSGEEFIELIEKNDFRFVWGVFSAFPKEVALEKILSKGIPSADGYTGFWENPINLQNSSAIIEMVLWDGELALIISHKDEIIDDFLNHYKFSENLEEYNNKNNCSKI